MNNDELYLATKDVINIVHPNLKVIKAYQNKRAPSGVYAVVNAVDTREAGYPPIIKTSNSAPVSSTIGQVTNVDFDVAYQLKSTVTINFYRDTASQLATAMISANYLPAVHTYLLKNKLGWGSARPVTNLSAPINGKYEERAQLQIVFLHEASRTDQTNAIYSTQVSVEDEKAQVLETIDVTAPKETG